MKTGNFTFMLLLAAFYVGQAVAQNVAINETGTNAADCAILDISSANKGILIPRVSLANTGVYGLAGTASNGLMVYNTNAAIAGTGAAGTGFYYWNTTTTLWTKIAEGASSGWQLTGNAGTIPGTHFVGTTGLEPLDFRTNGAIRTRIDASGNVGVGTTTPTQRLDVSGNLQFSGALMPNGNAGASGAFLRSAGAGAPPTWTVPGLTVTNVTSVESNANLCINGAFATYPGCQATLNLTTGQRVVALAQAGLMADSDCNGTSNTTRSVINARIAVNGADFANGAWLRTSLDNSVGYVMFNSISLIGEYTAPANGAYTFAMQAGLSSGSAAISGGNNASALQATMVLITYTP